MGAVKKGDLLATRARHGHSPDCQASKRSSLWRSVRVIGFAGLAVAPRNHDDLEMDRETP
jgi:hypothetical protein